MAAHVFMTIYYGKTIILWDGSPQFPPGKVAEFIKANCAPGTVSELLIVYDQKAADWRKVSPEIMRYMAGGVLPRTVTAAQLSARQAELTLKGAPSVRDISQQTQVNRVKTSDKQQQAVMNFVKG